MVIDAHTHLFRGYVTQRGLPAEEFATGLQQAGIDKALTFTLEEGFFGPSRPANDSLAAVTRQYPGLLYPACTVHPRDGEEAVREMERCARELGMVALKLHPWLQAFSVVEEGLVPILQTAARLSWPVVFHDGTPPYCTPLQIGYLSGRVPEATIILGHAGLSDFPREALAAARRHPNIVLCPCGVPLMWMGEYVRQVGAERIVYGSDYPFGGPESLHYYRAKFEALNLAAHERELILGGNIRRLIPALDRE
jgi:predicted TIM-barrel fold metal-dependent hydrolase